jgi:1-acyl-sn-glycerol-3-phosphate acyltransferase
MNSLLNALNPEQLKKNLLHWCYQPYKWLVFLPLLVASTHITTFCIMLAGALGLERAKRLAPVLWARFNARVTPVGVRVSGREHIVPGQSYVVVANHLSHFDILAVYGWLGIDIRWVMKQELRKIPALGYACELLGHVYIDRSNAIAANRSIDAAKSQLRHGTSIFFFPEGTRSRSGEMLPFKKGAFRLATELGLPVLPITLRGTHDILPSGSINLQPGDVEMIVHAPIHVNAETTADALSEQAREAIRSAL